MISPNELSIFFTLSDALSNRRNAFSALQKYINANVQHAAKIVIQYTKSRMSAMFPSCFGEEERGNTYLLEIVRDSSFTRSANSRNGHISFYLYNYVRLISHIDHVRKRSTILDKFN